MLGIRKVEHLAMRLEVPPRRLVQVADAAPSYYEELVLLDPARPDKVREVLNVVGSLRLLQRRLHDSVLAPARKPSKYSHGGVRSRNIKTNAAPHVGSPFVHTTDIADFYPSVHFGAIYRLFTNDFECSPDVARICTKLCTRDHHTPLGLITSPILADCLMGPADRRIGRMCEQLELAYSRFVDDITMSGGYPIDSGSARDLVRKVLRDYGFETNPQKERTGRMSEENAITKLYVKRGRLDVTRAYLTEVRSQLDTAAILARGGEIAAPYYTAAQILGRIHFIAWVNPGRRHELIRLFRSIDWKGVEAEAGARGLVRVRKRLVKKTDFERPAYAVPAAPDFEPSPTDSVAN